MAKRYRIVNLVLALVMIFSASTFAAGRVSDIDRHWARKEIIYLMDRDVMAGYDDGTFRPNRSISRAEFIKMVNNVFEYKAMGEIQFSDVKAKDWFYNDIRKAYTAGYINGYEDGTIKPNAPISRQEAAKILAVACGLENPDYDNLLGFKDLKKIGGWAVESVSLMVGHGYILGYDDGTFAPQKSISRAETAKILALVHRDLEKEGEGQEGEKPEEPEGPQEPDRPDEPEIPEEAEEPTEPELSLVDEFIRAVDQLPHPGDINKLVAEEKVRVEAARNIYTRLKPEERARIPQATMNKLLDVERKIESLKTLLMSTSKAEIRQAQAWAIKRGAHKRFVDVAEYYWAYGKLTGINPEILYGQAAKETRYGLYTGSVKPEMNNWAGIKIYDPKGDSTYDHEIFPSPEDGVRAHFNHMGIYCGVDPIGEPHPRWYKTSTASWAGSVIYVEDLSGKWAPSQDYGISIMRDYVKGIYNTPIPRKEDMELALDFSDMVEDIDGEDRLAVLAALETYASLTSSQRDLIPNNIKERLTDLTSLGQ